MLNLRLGFCVDSDALTVLGEWAISLHGMYESTLVFISIFKQKNLYIVGCVQCIWDITAYFLLPELKYYYEK
jgi:hypothetical protein